MNSYHHLLVIDPTAYSGGSKVASGNILRLLNKEQVRVTVLTADPDSWREFRRLQLFQPKWLAWQEQGLLYFLRHLFIAVNIMILRLRFGQIDIALGASGPGVDLALYLIKPVLRFQLVQLIHGPVATSRTIGRCLRIANEVHYLESSKKSLLSALTKVRAKSQKKIPGHFHCLQNGLPLHTWPSRCQHKQPVIFWAASLLKWKGLQTLLDALQYINPEVRPETHICYIQPKQTPLPISRAPLSITGVHWHENPRQLDTLRSGANIFVSTSRNEPFGLSILEAMAAGHCVVIPADGAYWDCILKNGIDCIKYPPDDAKDLASKLLCLSRDMERIRTLGMAAAKVALGYQAQTQYARIKNTLEGITNISEGEQTTPANAKLIP